MTDAPSPHEPSPKRLPPWVVLTAMAGVMVLGLGLWAWRRSVADRDPSRFKARVNALVKDLIQDHWNVMREAVAQVATDEGAKAFFSANAGLAPRIPSEAAFLRTCHAWRRVLEPLPESLPSLENRDLSYVKKEDGTEMSYRTAKGVRIFMRWASDGRLVEMRVY